ncbi:hypothetical protein G6F64_004237 [Rhizopus arrhizus]|uniref:ATP-dependent DNA helicase II subunit 2 n=1 Tax=Rhizopus oryzae TaxID=64495 RepID=A0A9P6XCZ1_RHIOR|nr:hypothetical protein G6F64_004237 [Rhizopus arrhizus]
MAQKKATVYILNISESMSSYPNGAFEKALGCIISSLEDKVLSGKKMDLASVILAGTHETDNPCAEESPGQYQHITTLCPLQQPSLDLLRKVAKTQPTQDPTTTPDVLDAVIIAIQMIVTHCKKLKYEKCVAVFTDAKHKIDWLDYEAISGALQENNITLLINGVDYHQRNDPSSPPEVQMNYKYWKELASQTPEGHVWEVDEMYDEIHRLRVKEVRPTPSYRGFLYLGNPTHENYLAISINMYLRVKEVKLPTADKYSKLSTGPSHAVTYETKYTVNNTTDPMNNEVEKVVSKEDLEKGFRFGKQRVKVSAEEEEYGKLKTKKEMTILGFIPKSNFPRYYLKSHPYVVAAGVHRPTESGMAISAIAYALHETDTLAFVKYVNKDDGAPKIGLLFPCFDENIALLQFVEIPFAGDVNTYIFRSIPSAIKRDDEADKMMDELIDEMDLNKLTDEEGNKYLDPNDTFNPVFWRINKAIKSRALNTSAPIPDMPKDFSPEFDTPEPFKARLKQISDKMMSHFDIKKVEEKGKKRDYAEADEESKTLVPIDELVQKNKLAKIQNPSIAVQKGILDITINTPVEDFKAMISHTESDLVSEAVDKMSKIVMTLITHSFGNQNYRKVIECLQVMRKTAAEEEESKVFNALLHQLKNWCELYDKTSPRREFWELLKDNDVCIITKQDTNDTDVQNLTSEDAVKFFEEGEQTQFISSNTNDEMADDDFNVDDLLAQMDY